MNRTRAAAVVITALALVIVTQTTARAQHSPLPGVHIEYSVQPSPGDLAEGSLKARGEPALAAPGAASGRAVMGDAASVARSAHTISVCRRGCAFTALAPALDAARDGDRIRVGPGRYEGGLAIRHSISVVGSGLRDTVITGSGDTSVLSVGTQGAPTEPTVFISDLTITGGRVRTGPESDAFVGEPGVVAEGGGIDVPFGADFSPGATLSLTRVVVSDNRVAPRSSAPGGPTCPNGSRCLYAEAAGGGISTWGDLTLDRVVVRDNRVGSASGLSDLASDANAGGIMSRLGTLTIRRSQISDNVAAAVAPIGRFADAGGIFAESGVVLLEDDVVSGNRATLRAALPSSVDLLAIAGGMHIGGSTSGHVERVRGSGNRASMTNSVGNAAASSGGLHTDAEITVNALTETGNAVTATTLGASTGNSQVDSGGGELFGSVTASSITGNRAVAISSAGDAFAYGGGSIAEGALSRTLLSGNLAEAIAPKGTAHAGGGGAVAGGGTVVVSHSRLSNNRAVARGRTGWARGGGVFAMVVPQGPPGGPLQIVDSSVTGNAATGLKPSGGGIFATPEHPLSLVRSFVRLNHPDDVANQSAG